MPQNDVAGAMIWTMRHPRATPEMLGSIPSFLDEANPRPAREQLDSNYRHAGGWCSFPGFEMLPDGNLRYPGDPPVQLLADTVLHGTETIRFYQHSWVAIVQSDGSYEISRMD